MAVGALTKGAIAGLVTIDFDTPAEPEKVQHGIRRGEDGSKEEVKPDVASPLGGQRGDIDLE